MNAEQFETLKNTVGFNCEACAAEQAENGECEQVRFTPNEYSGFKTTLQQINEDFSKESAEQSEYSLARPRENAELGLEKSENLEFSGESKDSEHDFLAENAPVVEWNDLEKNDSFEKDDNSEKNGELNSGSFREPDSGGAVCESGDGELENERYRSEFNEFRYGRYMSFVIADMRKTYGAGKITAVLGDFESEKPYAYAFTTRGLSAASGYVKNARKALKKSRAAQKNGDLFKIGSGKPAKKAYSLPKLCAVIGGEGTDSALLITLKEIRLAKKLGASEIAACISPSVAASGNKKAIKSEIKALKRACFNKTLKLGVNLSELTPLQAENVVSVGAALKIKTFTLYGSGAFFKLRRLKSLATASRFEVYSEISSARALSELIEGGADKIYTPHLTELSRSVRESFKSAKL